ncbi:MAG: transposase [Candidatus Acidiferrales bacterium]
MDQYTRNLPHCLPEGPPIFLTWRLYGSLPASFFSRLREIKKFSAGEEFRRADERLDHGDTGPVWLKDPRVAASVVRKLTHGDEALQHYSLHAYVVMSNHVHVLLTPKVPVRRLTNSLKGVTARAANKILQRSGQRFWQDESYDHWCRSLAEFARIREYIERNPVAAGLVAKASDWPWSSAHRNGK